MGMVTGQKSRDMCGMEIRKPAMLMIRQETGFKRKKKVNSTVTSTTPGTNWYPWRKVGKNEPVISMTTFNTWFATRTIKIKGGWFHDFG